MAKIRLTLREAFAKRLKIYDKFMPYPSIKFISEEGKEEWERWNRIVKRVGDNIQDFIVEVDND